MSSIIIEIGPKYQEIEKCEFISLLWGKVSKMK